MVKKWIHSVSKSLKIIIGIVTFRQLGNSYIILSFQEISNYIEIYFYNAKKEQSKLWFIHFLNSGLFFVCFLFFIPLFVKSKVVSKIEFVISKLLLRTRLDMSKYIKSIVTNNGTMILQLWQWKLPLILDKKTLPQFKWKINIKYLKKETFVELQVLKHVKVFNIGSKKVWVLYTTRPESQILVRFRSESDRQIMFCVWSIEKIQINIAIDTFIWLQNIKPKYSLNFLKAGEMWTMIYTITTIQVCCLRLECQYFHLTIANNCLKIGKKEWNSNTKEEFLVEIFVPEQSRGRIPAL